MVKNYLITGGAGFIGSNYARRLITRGENVTVFDNLSRMGAADNLDWVRSETGENSFLFLQGDIRDAGSIESAVKDQDVIIHLAAQVAVTSSVLDPVEDFSVNAQGTLNVLEAARKNDRQPIFIYASTNKVYGGLEDLEIIEGKTRYELKGNSYGVSEERCLDFHSPYGCSKGCGDQYVRDYDRIYGIPSIVYRQSCIFGTRQFGVEDQGWVAWFIIAAQKGLPLTIFGDGKQVRDLLFIDDLMNAYDAGISKIERSHGQIYNIGGGPNFSISIWTEFSQVLEKMIKKEIPVEFKDWRPGDQKVYISDIRKISEQLSWHPEVSIKEGIHCLQKWVAENERIFV